MSECYRKKQPSKGELRVVVLRCHELLKWLDEAFVFESAIWREQVKLCRQWCDSALMNPTTHDAVKIGEGWEGVYPTLFSRFVEHDNQPQPSEGEE